MAAGDLTGLSDIDGTVESTEYLHLEQTGDGLSTIWRLERRALREKLIQPNPLGDDSAFVIKQIATGSEEGLALVAEHEQFPVAMLAARKDFSTGTLSLIDVRVDYDHRRQGLATAMLFQAINYARENELRAVSAAVRANNLPGNQLLLRTSFDLSGVDTRRYSNHDVVKESATLIWYASLD
jgi:ribosomal protein S18 acetylase RimI-like enzyme